MAPARIALIGDVHANLAALEAVLHAVAERGITGGLVTGDLVMRGDEPEACVARVRALGWPCVAGNTDRKVAHRAPRPRWDPRGMRPGSRSWTRYALSEGSVAWLGALPTSRVCDLGDLRVLLTHGDGSEEDRDGDRALADTASRRGAGVVVRGHSHEASARTRRGVLIVNPGSVGEGRPGDRHPRWAWLEAGPDGPVAHLERLPENLARVRGD
jgi:protein phosphatase